MHNDTDIWKQKLAKVFYCIPDFGMKNLLINIPHLNKHCLNFFPYKKKKREGVIFLTL